MNKEKISEIILICRENGYEVRVRDIAFILLCTHFDDENVAYGSLFGEADALTVEAYSNSRHIVFLRNYLKENFFGSDNITFEENKAYMLKLKKDTEYAMAHNEIEKKDALKILADISVKLNDKFGAKEDIKDQIVVVNCKYNSICEGCGREIYIPTKDELIKKYNLIDSNKK